MTRCDVTVLGAGIFGLSIAWACVARGARVRVIDPHGPGAGASGGVLGALAPHVPENWNDKKAFQLNSLLRAEIFWPEVEAIGGWAGCSRWPMTPPYRWPARAKPRPMRFGKARRRGA